jgi:hypothetical protein
MLGAFLLCVATASAASPLVEDLVLQKMEQRYDQQMAGLASYQALRRYEASNPTLSQPAVRVLEEEYQSPQTRSFRMIDRSGAGFMDKFLFNKLLEIERETARPSIRSQVDLNRKNYNFYFEGYSSSTDSYIFSVYPRTAHPYLFQGRVWIDGKEFAVRRVEGSPAHKPSIWVQETHFVHEFAKFGDYWFPVRHQSEAQLRIFGKATLQITYSNYQWTSKAAGLQSSLREGEHTKGESR